MIQADPASVIPADPAYVDRWFARSGVPFFSATYTPADVAPVWFALLVIVSAFELTVLQWMDVSVRGALVVLAIFTVLLFPLFMVARTLWDPAREQDEITSRSRVLRAVPLGIGCAYVATVSHGSGLVDFCVLVGLLFCAGLVYRCRSTGAWSSASTAHRNTLTITPVALVPLMLINVEGEPPWSERIPPLDHLSNPPASLAVLPIMLALLLVAFRLPATIADGGRTEARWRSCAIPFAFLLVGLEATVAPYVPPIWWVSPFVLVIAGSAIVNVSMLLRSRAGAAITAWMNGHPKLVKGTVAAIGVGLYLVELPTLATVASTRMSPGQGLILNAIFALVTGVIVLFALDQTARAMVGEAARSATATAGALAQGLPLLLVVLVFFGVSSDLWQVADMLSRARFLAMLGLLGGMILAFALVRSFLDVQTLGTFANGKSLRASAPTDDPRLASLVSDVADRVNTGISVKLSFLQRVNATFALTTYQLIYAGLVAIGMAAGFYLLGRIAISQDLLESWFKDLPDHRGFAAASPFDQPWTRVAMLLGLFSSFQFLVQFNQDADLRRQVMQRPDGALRRRMAVMVAYAETYPHPPAQTRPRRFFRDKEVAGSPAERTSRTGSTPDAA